MANNLTSERVRAGLSRKEVAEHIGRSVEVIGKWERGESSPLLFPDGVALAKLRFAWGLCTFIAGFFCAAILAASKSE